MKSVANNSVSLREPSRPSRLAGKPRCAAFTLIELLTVIGIIAIFSGIAALALRGGDKSQARDAAVSTLASLVASARGHAALRGVDAALLINNDTANPDRYRRYVVVCIENTTTGAWEPTDGGVTLPVGVYVMTNATTLPTSGPGLFRSPIDVWVRSSALSAGVAEAVNSSTSELWSIVVFKPIGTTGTSGDIAIATGRPLYGAAPASVLLETPENVSGISISSYGSVTILRHREDF